MSNTIRSVCVWAVGAGILANACASDDGEDDTRGDDTSSSAGVGVSATAPGDDAPGPSTDVADESSTDPEPPGDSSTAGDGPGESSSEGDSSGGESGGAVGYDPEFVWVADFLRGNCSGCHATNMNGNLVLPSADIDNEEVRLALDGVVANTGLLLVQPGDHQASQTWLQITNEFGAVFPVEDTDRFGAWIDAGAPYYAE